MSIKYQVTLTNEEREQLSQLIQKGATQGYRIRHAQILLALDEIEANKEWTDKKISIAYHTTEKSIYNMRRRFVEQGFSAALERQKRATPPNIKIDAETEAKIVLVMDNLNTHSLASLYQTFPQAEARRLAERFEIHFTPKHASWLDMAEIEIGVMCRQVLNKRIPSKELMTQKLHAWMLHRNLSNSTVKWQFTTQDARIKLQHLYPKF